MQHHVTSLWCLPGLGRLRSGPSWPESFPHPWCKLSGIQVAENSEVIAAWSISPTELISLRISGFGRWTESEEARARNVLQTQWWDRWSAFKVAKQACQICPIQFCRGFITLGLVDRKAIPAFVHREVGPKDCQGSLFSCASSDFLFCLRQPMWPEVCSPRDETASHSCGPGWCWPVELGELWMSFRE